MNQIPPLSGYGKVDEKCLETDGEYARRILGYVAALVFTGVCFGFIVAAVLP